MINFLASILGRLLRIVYEVISQIGTEPEHFSYYAIAVVVTTIIFKLCLIPLNISQTKNQMKMAEYQPEIQKLQQKYKNDPQTMQVKLNKLYKENDYNPMAGCLPMLIQFPIIISFYRIFQNPAKFAFTEPGVFESINKTLFHIVNLDNPDPTIILPAVAAALTALSTHLAQKNQPQTAAQTEDGQNPGQTMLLIMPIMIYFFARRMAAGLVLYWITSSIFTSIQQAITNRLVNKTKEEEMA